MEILKTYLSSHPLFGPAFTPPPIIPLFQWYPQNKEIFIKSQDEMVKLTI
jgi:hypothetical protein